MQMTLCSVQYIHSPIAPEKKPICCHKAGNVDHQAVSITGSMFGGIALFENVCFMVGSVAGGAIYSETVSFLPGFAFWVMAGYNVIALFLLM